MNLTIILIVLGACIMTALIGLVIGLAKYPGFPPPPPPKPSKLCACWEFLGDNPRCPIEAHRVIYKSLEAHDADEQLVQRMNTWGRR